MSVFLNARFRPSKRYCIFGFFELVGEVLKGKWVRSHVLGFSFWLSWRESTSKRPHGYTGMTARTGTMTARTGTKNVSFGMPGTQWRPNFNKSKEAMLRAARVCPPASVYVCTKDAYLYILIICWRVICLYNQKAQRESGTVPPRGLGTVPPLGGPLSHYKNRGVWGFWCKHLVPISVFGFSVFFSIGTFWGFLFFFSDIQQPLFVQNLFMRQLT